MIQVVFFVPDRVQLNCMYRFHLPLDNCYMILSSMVCKTSEVIESKYVENVSLVGTTELDSGHSLDFVSI